MNDDQMVKWLGEAARDCREAAGLRRIQIASQAGLHTDVTVKRFEEGRTWPRNIDQLLATYAETCSALENDECWVKGDPRNIWQRALDNWRANDEAPSNPKVRGR